MLSEFIVYFKLGLLHILDLKAYDHILFITLITIPFLFKDFKSLIRLVTVFTIGHTLALVLDTYNIVSVNKKMIEFLIPLTILLTGIFNIFIKSKGSKDSASILFLISTLFFGLVHGFGFSSYYQMIQNGGDSQFLTLIEFALGIEVGQVIIVLIALVVASIFQSLFRFSRKEWILTASGIIIGLTIPMLIRNYPF